MNAAADLITLEGAFLVERALRAGLELTRVACVGAREDWIRGLLGGRGGMPPEIEVLPERELAAIAGYPFHRGVLALARRPAETPLAELAGRFSCVAAKDGAAEARTRATLLAVPELRDPENLGSIFRSAAALGCDALLLGPGGPDPLSRRVLRVSMGASLDLPWARLGGPSGLAVFENLGFRSAACVLDPEARDLRGYSRPPRLVIVLGDEASGLSSGWMEACEERLTLPMRGGTDSLNVAVAAALFAFVLNLSAKPIPK